MAIVMTGTAPMREPEYDRVMTALAGQLTRADGFRAHFAHSVGPDRWTVVEVWDSAEQQAAWYDAHVRPHLPAGAPAPVIEQLHNLLLATTSYEDETT